MKKILAFIFMMTFGLYLNLYPCTVFYATDGNKMLGGNNEDWSDSNTKIWFYPPEEGKFGWVKVGFAGGFPQGGMNDQVLGVYRPQNWITSVLELV